MKKFLTLFLTGIFVMIAAVSCSDDDKDIKITYDQLPKAAQTFLETYYNGIEPMSIDRDGKHVDTEYDVKLSNGHDIEFAANGDWLSVEAPDGAEIPDGIIPTAVAYYLEQNYPDYGVSGIELTTYGYEVELTDGTEIMLTREGGLYQPTA